MVRLKAFILLLCLSTFTNAQDIIHIPMGQNINKSQELPVSEIAESIRFVPLETNENCLLNTDISKIEIVEETIFMSDFNYIFKYDLNGRFIKRIGKKGRGPGEYSQGFQSFLIDETRQNLIIFDMVSQRMIKYDFEGNFVEEKKINFLPGPLEWISEDNFAVFNMGFTYENEPWNDFYVLSRDAKTVQKNRFKKQSDKKYGLNIYPAIFYRFEGKTRYKNPHENVIYELDEKNKPKAVYYLDFWKYEKYNDAYDMEVQIKNNVGISRANPDSFEKIGLLGLSETGDFFFINYGYQDQRIAGVYDKKKNTFYNLFDTNFSLFGFHDNLYNGLPVFPVVGIRKNMMYSYYTALDFKENLKRVNDLAPDLQKIKNEIDENDNPVLLLVKLKE